MLAGAMPRVVLAAVFALAAAGSAATSEALTVDETAELALPVPLPEPTKEPRTATDDPEQPRRLMHWCMDLDDGLVPAITDKFGESCSTYQLYPNACGQYNDADFSSETMCCACGGGGACSNTDILTGVVDSYGDDCSGYDANPSWCGGYDDYVFQSLDMCCGCGGGQICQNIDYGRTDPFGDECTAYSENPTWCGGYDDEDFTSNEFCCVCGGGYFEGSGRTLCSNSDKGAMDVLGYSCDRYEAMEGQYCDSQNFNDDDFTAATMCCVCGGGIYTQAPTLFPTSVSPTITPVPSAQEGGNVYSYFECSADGSLVSYGEECADDACADCESGAIDVPSGSCYLAGGYPHIITCDSTADVVTVKIYENAGLDCTSDLSRLTADQVHSEPSGGCAVEEHDHGGADESSSCVDCTRRLNGGRHLLFGYFLDPGNTNCC